MGTATDMATVTGMTGAARWTGPAYGCSRSRAQSAPLAPTNLAYTSFMLSVAYSGTFAESVAVVLPCAWIYLEVGKQLAEKQGCLVCHTTDGTAKIGPSWKGVFGTDEKLVGGGTAKVDENYLKESILDPTAKVVDGFTPSMPPYQGKLSDRQVDAIIAYIKSLK